MTTLALTRKRSTKAALIDGDPRSQTTTDWCGIAAATWPANISVFPWHDAQSMKHHVARIRPDYDDIVRDTDGSRQDVLEACLEETQMLICPVAGTGPEYRRVPATVQIAQQVAAIRNPELLIAVLFVKVRKGSPEVKAMREQLAESGIAVFDTEVTYSIPRYARPFGSVPKDLGAYDDVADEIIDVLKDRA